MAETREEIIKSLMEHSGFSRADAEEAAAIELGEVPGDVVDLEAEGGDDDG